MKISSVIKTFPFYQCCGWALGIVLMPIRIRLTIRLRSRSGSGSGIRSFPKFYTCWKIRTNFLTFIPSSASLYYFSFLVKRHRCQNFQYFGQSIDIFWKKYILALHLVEMDMGPDPDRQALDADPAKWFRADPDPQHCFLLQMSIKIYRYAPTKNVIRC